MARKKRNQDIRNMISKSGLYQWEAAGLVGISEVTMCVWLRKPLSEERKNRIIKAIDKIR